MGALKRSSVVDFLLHYKLGPNDVLKFYILSVQKSGFIGFLSVFFSDLNE